MADVPPEVLVIDDDPEFHDLIAWFLERQGYAATCVTTFEAALESIDTAPPAVVLLDWQLGDASGLELIPQLRTQLPNSPVIMVTAHASPQLAVESIRAGAFDFLTKPLDEARALTMLAKAVEHQTLLTRLERLQEGDESGVSFEGLIGSSPQMRTLFRIIREAGPTDASVMIVGESGTGKELVARAIHRRSARASGPFVALNMAALPGELVESTLCGHEKGAFTSASTRRRGAFEEAHGGTIFLDEICEMPLELQAKLLRFLQEKIYRPVGADRDSTSDCRVVSATNKDPLEEVRTGRMRNDLYYRLHVVPIVVPPLRDRGSDIELLARHALLENARKYGKKFRSIETTALKRLRGCSWPGNVRQLLHVLESVAVLSDGEALTSEMLPGNLDERVSEQPLTPTASREEAMTVEEPRPSGPGEDVVVPLAELERRACAHALKACGGSVPEAARRLGISSATMYRKIKAFDLQARG